jgi:SAM-dependent methyltransferase
MSNIIFLLKEIAKGKSMARALFNRSLSVFSISGDVLDVGGGKHQDYLDFIKGGREARVRAVDLEVKGGIQGQEKRQNAGRIDFEKDPLPCLNGTIDHTLAFNVLEHIFNHQFLVGEMYRIIKPGGTLIGFVPFLVNYHPDPHDYFRYTKEALRKILLKGGFKDIEVKEIGRGPFAVNYNTIMLSFPKCIRVIIFPCYYLLDSIFLLIRPHIGVRYPLGYLFYAKK